MDIIPAHMNDAVHTSSNESPPKRIKSTRAASGRRTLNSVHFSSHYQAPSTPVSDHSSDSDLEAEDYATDYTSPDTSEMPDDVEEFRDREYPQLKGKTYLDHGGTTLYAKSLVEEFSADLISNLYGNPHSASTPSALAGHRVDTIRDRALRFFNADPEHFDLVFVANATAAIKLVIDCFKDYAAVSNTPVWYGYHKDAHTSLVGVRESTKLHRCFATDEEVDIWINSGGLGGPRARQLGLFAYPGQSNMSGRRLPLNWCGRIRKSFHKAATYTLLDAAALASTAPLDLSDPATAPDFVALSFYKIFGFPNIGALIVRKESAHVLESRKYFGGGTVDMVIAVNDTWHAKKNSSIHDRLEDGTLPFHSIFALDHGMNVHERLYGPNPMKFISHHTSQLGKQLYNSLSNLTHSNGLPLCRIYKDDNTTYGDPSVQGATVPFNVQLADGSMVPYEEVEEAADDQGIFVRSGSLCNPGGMATYLNWSPAEMKAAYAAGHRCSKPTQIMLGKPTGVVRVSLGAMSIAADVQNLIRFLDNTYCHGANQALLSTPMSLAHSTPLSPPPSPGPKTTISPLNIPHALYVPPQQSDPGLTQSTPGRPGIPDHTSSDSTALPQHPSTHPTIEPERAKAPPWNPQDYINMRKPWEAEMRKQHAQNYNNVGMESKVHELEDASTFSRNPTPSVKARKFGRSVVNLLRTKSHFVESNRVPPLPTPVPTTNPPLPPGEPPREGSNSQRSRKSVEKQRFQDNVDALGL
ncbi:hypothetical protein LTR91_010834 [Friedmanniomyces endolithicus]|uniref:Aminotransferase class V domain-containing protein n=1 Tax=Friedmanniomyces endolithicus TaxID=329885 RepID=A0AAN6KIN2_9PEZI|nr:hypothetical protein LTR57_022359 [Friedmanniomyces endolithicus]KAK0976686.1 hypothetical protein LTS01_013377 [Friedmanniomyces endolithicus]KAK0984591.1 hypothetical protein LTR91_010834 [Friedmanniomyces endolithicus]KAK1021558.1 hypothetical protein LTS16_026421 [Friedmanniomyces endolithicus]